jgi:hypothetical protein
MLIGTLTFVRRIPRNNAHKRPSHIFQSALCSIEVRGRVLLMTGAPTSVSNLAPGAARVIMQWYQHLVSISFGVAVPKDEYRLSLLTRFQWGHRLPGSGNDA